MKEFVKMTKHELAVFFLMSICSGMMIGIGGVASLVAQTTLEEGGKLVGSVLFSLGIFAIITYEMRLFTGMVADLPKMGWKNTWKLPLCFLGNMIGVAFVALLVYFTPLREAVVTQSKLISASKLEANRWTLSALCSSILCGALITLSVWSVNHTPRKGLNATLGVTFPIIVFAFCGFDHSVANLLYFYLSGTFSWQVVGYEVLCIVGNVLGGIILPLFTLYNEHAQKRR